MKKSQNVKNIKKERMDEIPPSPEGKGILSSTQDEKIFYFRMEWERISKRVKAKIKPAHNHINDKIILIGTPILLLLFIILFFYHELYLENFLFTLKIYSLILQQ